MFPAEAKAKAEKMIKNIFIALKIESITLLGCQETKVSAVEKLHMSKIKIGYPDKWKIIQP
jgi:endothelin-converting enzyme/putative endopeptidase